jgi:two-component system chemotaxis sensor kinase CheA
MGIRSDLESTFDFDIIDEFFDHYSLMMDSMETMVIDLSKPEEHVRIIDELFRVFHNIKSASGYLKITSMTKLASFVESQLEILRDSDKPITEETINWLLAIHDMFEQWHDDFNNDNKLSRIKYSLLKIPDLDK